MSTTVSRFEIEPNAEAGEKRGPTTRYPVGYFQSRRHFGFLEIYRCRRTSCGHCQQRHVRTGRYRWSSQQRLSNTKGAAQPTRFLAVYTDGPFARAGEIAWSMGLCRAQSNDATSHLLWLWEETRGLLPRISGSMWHPAH